MTKNGVYSILEGRRTLLHKKAVSDSLEKGGGADGEETDSLCDLSGRDLVDHVLLGPKSVLTVRPAPERST